MRKLLIVIAIFGVLAVSAGCEKKASADKAKSEHNEHDGHDHGSHDGHNH